MMRIPTATYRIQFDPAFGFQAAKKIIHYLAELGISDVYVSPIFKARKGSVHGYDIVDPTRLNPELGSMSDFEELVERVKNFEMGWLQDIVPNHMAFDHENQMLMDVLENGQRSEYFHFFDIEWNHTYDSIRGKLLAPFLGQFYGESLENKEIQLQYDETGLSVNYYNLKFPLKIESYAILLVHQLSKLKRKLGEDHSDFIKLLGILYILKTLSSMEEDTERYDQIKFIKRMLWELYTQNQEIKKFLEENIELFNGRKGTPESFILLDTLLSEQLFRLSFWKVATEEINYRRFFNINDLISLKIEDKDVFNRTHSLIFNLIQKEIISGLRIDHIDGLYDPTEYLKTLRDKTGGIYTVIEKILDLEEELPAIWPVQGTTGYDFLNHTNGIFCQTKNKRTFDKIYSLFTGFKTTYEDLVSEKKRLIIGKHMAGDVDNLAHLMKTISSRYRHGGDITLYGLKRAIVEVMALFPVYRTYISSEVFSERDRSYIKATINKARESNQALFYELNFIEEFLLFTAEDYLSEEEKNQWLHFVMRFQQLTGPVTAKGFEDTLLYVYNRLLSLNEVGGNPGTFGIGVREFHSFNKKRAKLWPHSMNTTSTHDTKRGEDVRARINVLSEIPREWESNIKRWTRINKRKKRTVNGRNVPDRNDEYFLYQTLVGAFPFDETQYSYFFERVKSYIIKAVREAKVHTAWLRPDTGYEEAFISFIEKILGPPGENGFLREFLPFQKKVAYYGIYNSLSQTLIKITSPGVPDFYQGTELWDLNLVDPDNRRPVDFEKRRSWLRDIKDKARADVLNLVAELFSTKEDGRLKLFLINRALQARKKHLDLFQKGMYIPVEVGGTRKAHVVAFARKHGNACALTIAPRLLTAVIQEGELPLGQQVWDTTHIILPKEMPSVWKDAITARIIKCEETLPVSEALKHFPMALLIGEEER